MNDNTQKRTDNAYIAFRHMEHVAVSVEILPAKLLLIIKESNS